MLCVRCVRFFFFVYKIQFEYIFWAYNKTTKKTYIFKIIGFIHFENTRKMIELNWFFLFITQFTVLCVHTFFGKITFCLKCKNKFEEKKNFLLKSFNAICALCTTVKLNLWSLTFYGNNFQLAKMCWEKGSLRYGYTAEIRIKSTIYVGWSYGFMLSMHHFIIIRYMHASICINVYLCCYYVLKC